MLISIIIPTYNRAHLIVETLDSILEQTYTIWECIVIDDGSTDDTADILAKYIEKDDRFQYYQRPKEKTKGPNSCRNFGFELSKGDYIQWFDSDDVMKKHCLETKMRFFEKSLDVVISKLSLFDFEKNIEINQSKIVSNDLIFDYFCGNIALYVSGPLWNRVFLEKKPFLFDENIINCDDWDFNMRMLYYNPKCFILDESLINYRKHPESLSREIEKKHFIEIKKVSNLLDRHLILLKKNEIIDLRKFYQYAINYNKSYLKEAILAKDGIQYFLLFRISKYCICNNFWFVFFRIWILKITYFLFGKLYHFLKK